jgi:hypothetical protein
MNGHPPIIRVPGSTRYRKWCVAMVAAELFMWPCRSWVINDFRCLFPSSFLPLFQRCGSLATLSRHHIQTIKMGVYLAGINPIHCHIRCVPYRSKYFLRRCSTPSITYPKHPLSRYLDARGH